MIVNDHLRVFGMLEVGVFQSNVARQFRVNINTVNPFW